jgi:hypothetical protein
MVRHREVLSSAGAKLDPCLPSGYTSTAGGLPGGGSWDQCRAAAKKLLPAEPCSFDSCSIGNVFTPSVEGPIIGIDNFFYVSARAAAECGPLCSLNKWIHPGCAALLPGRNPWHSRFALVRRLAPVAAPSRPARRSRPPAAPPVLPAPPADGARAAAQAGRGQAVGLRGRRQKVLRQGLGRD